MVEGGAKILPESVILEALFAAHEACQALIGVQEDLQRKVGKPKRTVVPPAVDEALTAAVKEFATPKLKAALAKGVKQERYAALDAVHDEAIGKFAADAPDRDEAGRAAGRQGDEARRPRADHHRAQAPRRPRARRHSADHLRGRRPAARARLGALHARRDAGARGRHARHVIRRAEDRRTDRRVLQEVHAALQLPAIQHRRGEVPARPRPPRDRPRRARRARDPAGAARRRRRSPTPSASSRRSSSRTARRRWRLCAAARSR